MGTIVLMFMVLMYKPTTSTITRLPKTLQHCVQFNALSLPTPNRLLLNKQNKRKKVLEREKKKGRGMEAETKVKHISF